MSKAANALAGKLKPSYFEDTVAKRLAAREIDAAVAPLVKACEAMAARLRVDSTTDRAWVAEQAKALEPWRLK